MSHGIKKRVSAMLLGIGMLFVGIPTVLAAQEELAVTESEVEEEVDAARALVVFVDKPIVLTEGVEPRFPPVPEIVFPPNEVEETADLLSMNQFNLSIQQLENDGGAWNSALIETLTGLGNLQQELQNHIDALETFDRALHISRINNGLYTADQLPVLSEIIESYLALGNWEQADLYHDYQLFVQQRTFGASDPRVIPMLADFGEWNIRAFSIGYGNVLGLRLSTAQIAFNAAFRLLSTHYGRSDERFIPYLHNIAISAYLVAIHPGLVDKLDRTEFLMEQEDFRKMFDEEGSHIPQGFAPGQRALLEIIAYHEEEGSDVRTLARAKADLADWYLLFNRRRDAEELYLDIWNFLGEQENGAALQQELFGKAVPIPTWDMTPRLINPRGSDRPDRGHLRSDFGDYIFEVSRLGEARRVEIVDEETAPNPGHLQRVARELRQQYFRPALEEGVPVTSDDNRVRIRFWY